MKKLTMERGMSITFSEGCEKHLLNCKQRNLREGTLNHYRQSYLQFYKFFDPDMPLTEINVDMYNSFVLYLRDRLDNDVSVRTYLRDLITVLHYLMREGDLEPFNNPPSLNTSHKIKEAEGDNNIIFVYVKGNLISI